MSVEFERKTHKKRRWGKVFEYGSYKRRIVYEKEYDDLKAKIEKQLDKSTAGFTSQELAQQHDVRVSIIKNILNEFVTEKKAVIVLKSKRTCLYRKS